MSRTISTGMELLLFADDWVGKKHIYIYIYMLQVKQKKRLAWLLVCGVYVYMFIWERGQIRQSKTEARD